MLLVCCSAVCYGLSVFVLHKNDTNSCKSFEIRTKFVRISYEIRNNHIQGTYSRYFGDEIRTKFVRNSPELRTNFARISCEFRANFVRISYHFCRTVAEEPHQHHRCMQQSPYTHTHFPVPAPPAHTHPQTHTHTHRQTHTHPCTNTLTFAESKQPPTRPTPTHCPPTHPHTYLDSGCVTVECLGGGVLCVCVCVSACVCGWVSADVFVCVWVGGSACPCVVGCEVVCVCVYARVGVRCGKGVSVCVRACVCVCVWLVRISGFVLLTSSLPSPPHRRTPTPRTKKTVMHPPPPSHIPSMKANSPSLDPHPHTARPHTLIRTWTVDVSQLNV